MYKYLGNYNFDFEIELDKLTYHSHKINKYSDEDSKSAKE